MPIPRSELIDSGMFYENVHSIILFTENEEEIRTIGEAKE